MPRRTASIRTRRLAAALAAALVSAAPALAGEIADAGAEAEALLRGGAPAATWEAFDRATELFWAEAPLHFRAVLLVKSVAGFGQYEARASDAFAAGDRLTAYIEPVGYGWTAIGDSYRIRFTVDVEIASDDRGVIAAEEGFAILERFGETRSREFQATVSLTLPALPPGNYTLNLTFHDAATGKAATAQVEFGIDG